MDSRIPQSRSRAYRGRNHFQVCVCIPCNSHSKTKQFADIVNALKLLYHSPVLIPTCKDFNLNYFFIISELEEFFELFHLDPFRYDPKQTLPVIIFSPHHKYVDTDKRLIDEHFIQLCSPFLDELYSTLKKANMKTAGHPPVPIKKDRGSVTPLTQDASREVRHDLHLTLADNKDCISPPKNAEAMVLLATS